MFSAHGKIDLKRHQMGPGGFSFVLTNPDLANILGDAGFDFENFYLLNLLDSKFPDFQVPRFPDFEKSGLGLAWPGPGLSLWGNRSWVMGEPPSRPTLTDILSKL